MGTSRNKTWSVELHCGPKFLLNKEVSWRNCEDCFDKEPKQGDFVKTRDDFYIDKPPSSDIFGLEMGYIWWKGNRCQEIETKVFEKNFMPWISWEHPHNIPIDTKCYKFHLTFDHFFFTEAEEELSKFYIVWLGRLRNDNFVYSMGNMPNKGVPGKEMACGSIPVSLLVDITRSRVSTLRIIVRNYKISKTSILAAVCRMACPRHFSYIFC